MSGLLKRYISGFLNEDFDRKKQILLNGEVATEFGSFAHIRELEKTMETLVRLRNYQRRGSINRFAYSTAITRLRQQIKKLKNLAEKPPNNKRRKQ